MEFVPLTEEHPEAHFMITQTNDKLERSLSFKNYKGFKHVENISHYKIGKELGHGSFGSVYYAKNKDTKVPVAIKIIKKSKLAENEVYIELLRNELFVLEKTDHPHITRVFEILEDKRNFYVVMEFLSGGNLMDKIISI